MIMIVFMREESSFMENIINIVLVCQYGASTDMLALKIEDTAKKEGKNIIINAHPLAELHEYIDAADIVLLAPQVRFKYNSLLEMYKNKDVKFMIVETRDYGMMNGKKVLNDALKMLES